MKYEYTPFLNPQDPHMLLRRKPLIEIELFGPSDNIRISHALIDSGADYSLFNIEYAKQIGVNIENCKIMDFTGISGQDKKLSAYMTKVDIEVKHLENSRTTIFAGFVDSNSVDAILGQEGFFDNFRIKFEKDHNIFEINPVKRKK